jgi:hypothetical protein
MLATRTRLARGEKQMKQSSLLQCTSMPSLTAFVTQYFCVNTKCFGSLGVSDVRTYVCMQTPWSESASVLYRPRDSRLSAKLVSTIEGAT